MPWGNTIGGEHDAPFQSLGTRTGNISGTGTIELVTGGVAVQTINTGMVATNLISHQQRWTKDLQHPIGSGHFVSDGTVVCALTYPSAGNAAEQLVCMRLTDGMVVLNALPGRAFTPDPDLAIHDGAIYIASTNHDSVGYLQAYDLQGGQQLFERAVQPHHRALVFAGQRVLVEGAPCPATQAGCIEALDERSGVVKATFPVAKSITFLWQKNGKPYFRSPNFQTVTYDTAKDAFLDVSSDFASLNAHAVPPGTFGNGDFDLYGWSDPMADGAVYGIAQALPTQRYLCRWDSNKLQAVWCIDAGSYAHLQAFPNVLLVSGTGPTLAIDAATGAVPNGKNQLALCAERWCFDQSGLYAEVQP